MPQLAMAPMKRKCFPNSLPISSSIRDVSTTSLASGAPLQTPTTTTNGPDFTPGSIPGTDWNGLSPIDQPPLTFSI
eukprot:1446033-Ditylum_brightwellii.AAC.1